MNRLSEPLPAPCPGYRRDVMFPDVEPDVLAREAAVERERSGASGATPWQAYLHRVLPAMERDLPAEMAQALLLGDGGIVGNGILSARRHAAAMRRRSIADGDVRRVRFWGEVLQAIDRAEG